MYIYKLDKTDRTHTRIRTYHYSQQIAMDIMVTVVTTFTLELCATTCASILYIYFLPYAIFD